MPSVLLIALWELQYLVGAEILFCPPKYVIVLLVNSKKEDWTSATHV